MSHKESKPAGDIAKFTSRMPHELWRALMIHGVDNKLSFQEVLTRAGYEYAEKHGLLVKQTTEGK
ncbi:hypothetical protein AE925_15145 [Xanthomonas arboricola]|nr:hypothetical protein AE925_15145 [Xanthomonas arboricola]KOB39863.1 hypothetical protein AE931_20500 [Xanthomonas arboricola]